MKRLPNNFGSVYKLNGSRRKPYAVRITDGRKPNGQANYKYLGYYATYKEALEALTAYNQNPYNLDLSNSTISDMWAMFQERRFDKLSVKSIKSYKASYNHLKPLHNTCIRDLRTYQLQRVIDNIPYKWQVKTNVQILLRQMFDMALELDIANKNYAEYIKIDRGEQSAMHKAFTKEEISKLFRAVFTEPWADAVLITIYTGLRPSELLAIKTADVSIQGRYMTGGLKTKAGKNRIIPIHNKILPFIRKRYNPDNVFLIDDKGPVSYEHYRNEFKALMKALDMEHLPHDGRHTFASMADSAGMNKTAVKMIMGHSSKDITERVYTHKDVEELIQNVNML